MKVLVTGAAGFIGAHTAQRLVARGDHVVGLDNFDPFYGRAPKERNIAAVRAADPGGRFEFVEGDILDTELLDRVMARGFDVVLHQAGLAGVRPSIASPWRYQQVNVVGTARVAEAMAKHGIDRMVFASSSSVYGDNEQLPYAENQRVDLPASPYAASKRACELLLRSLHAVSGLHSTSLRYFTVYGPRQRPEMAIHKFCRLIEDGKPVTLFGDGSTSRDYTYVDDIVTGTLGALDSRGEGARIYNLGNTHPVKLNELVNAIGKALGKEPTVEHIELQPGDVMHTWANVEAASRDLGYAPTVGIEEGLSRFAAWMRAQS